MSAAGDSPMPGAARTVVVIGGGPAGLMAAETARDLGASVALYEQMPSVARKFLIAGKGGLNLTHSEPFERFVSRYGERSDVVGAWLRAFDADALREWAQQLGYATVIGSSGRVFPTDFKAGPLLRAWVRRIRSKGVAIHCNHRWLGGTDTRSLAFAHGSETVQVATDAIVLALGGGSWPQLGADGAWVPLLQNHGLQVAPLIPSNCGFVCPWSATLVQRHAGAPVKSVRLRVMRLAQTEPSAWISGEFVLTHYGVEGSAVYALSAALRDAIEQDGAVHLQIDLCPQRSVQELSAALARPRGSRSESEHLRRTVGIEGVKAGLLYERTDAQTRQQPEILAATLKALSLRLIGTRPLAEAISSAGGLSFDELSEQLLLRSQPGVWCAGEMLDWEAPTGGYLLTACFASGFIAGRAAAQSP